MRDVELIRSRMWYARHTAGMGDEGPSGGAAVTVTLRYVVPPTPLPFPPPPPFPTLVNAAPRLRLRLCQRILHHRQGM